MKKISLVIELIDDLVMSAQAATAGGHGSLRHIPGASLLGVAAARLYNNKTLSAQELFDVFHSGRVQFGYGLPIFGGCRAAPVPLSFHHAKAESPTAADDKSQLNHKEIRNFAQLPAKLADNRQPKPLREGFITDSGQWLRPTTTYRMKTAIDPATRFASEGQLFGYEALSAGQRFGALLSADDEISQDLFNRIAAALSGEVRLGRSRSAEYGRVSISQCDGFEKFRQTAQSNAPVLETTIWAISDLALVDPDSGVPQLLPTAATLGLRGSDIQVDLRRTFIRTRGYAPYNAKRRAYELERHVISQGSVITLTSKSGFNANQLAMLAAGVGMHREAGLGELMVNAQLLASQQPQFAPISHLKETPKTAPRPELTADSQTFIHWLKRETGLGFAVEKAIRKAAEMLDEYKQIQETARLYLGLRKGEHVGPSASQWGTVYECARYAQAKSTLFAELRLKIKRNAEGWNEQYVDANKNALQTFHEWFHARLDAIAIANETDEYVCALTREFAKRAMDNAKRKDVHASEAQAGATK